MVAPHRCPLSCYLVVADQPRKKRRVRGCLPSRLLVVVWRQIVEIFFSDSAALASTSSVLGWNRKVDTIGWTAVERSKLSL